MWELQAGRTAVLEVTEHAAQVRDPVPYPINRAGLLQMAPAAGHCWPTPRDHSQQGTCGGWDMRWDMGAALPANVVLLPFKVYACLEAAA